MIISKGQPLVRKKSCDYADHKSRCMWDPHRGGDELGRLAGAPGDVSHTDRVVVASHQGLHHLPSQRVIHCTGLQ